MTIVSLTIARPAVMTEGGGFVPSAVAVAAPVCAARADHRRHQRHGGYADQHRRRVMGSERAVAGVSRRGEDARQRHRRDQHLDGGPGPQLRPRHTALDARDRSFIWHRCHVRRMDAQRGGPARHGGSNWTSRAFRRPDRSDRTNGHARPARHQRRDRSIRANRTIRHAGHSWRRDRSDGSVGNTGHRWRDRRRPAQPVRSAAGTSGGEVMVNGQLVVTAAAGALTVAVKTLAGADPSAGSPVVFRIPNASGTYDASTSRARCRWSCPTVRKLGVRPPPPRSACGWSRSTTVARSCSASAACRPK